MLVLEAKTSTWMFTGSVLLDALQISGRRKGGERPEQNMNQDSEVRIVDLEAEDDGPLRPETPVDRHFPDAPASSPDQQRL
ncbi:hypothetical protein [Arthrobacter sp. RIT-PI-e]|uniref:hypothetical protein n=1 Tax=Arthrobacter sp. RIT-PI-e TaxID=1681197 RepID=UPI00128F56CE|nr:hypothetical protein [Arthrobacter sp. RIT-PI-e]